MKVSSRKLELIIKFLQANEGHFFKIATEYREKPGVLRFYNPKWKNKKALKGGVLPYSKVKKNLLIVWDKLADENKGGWRAVNCNDIVFVAIRTKFSEEPFVIIDDVKNYSHCEGYGKILKQRNDLRKNNAGETKEVLNFLTQLHTVESEELIPA